MPRDSSIADRCSHDLCRFSILDSRNNLLLFDDNKINMARKPGKKQKENPVMFTGEGKRVKGNIRERSKEGKTGTVLELSLKIKSWQSCTRFSFSEKYWNVGKAHKNTK